MSRLWPFAVAFVALLAAPLLLTPRSVGVDPEPVQGQARRVIIVTPHNEQIRHEFSLAFRAWHERHHGEPAEVVWSTPGGTVEIRRALTSAWESRLRQGLPVGGDADLVFGGGSYEFDTLKRPVKVLMDGEERSETILQPLALPEHVVQGCYASGELAGQRLYDPDGWWYGVALSTFGIVWNQDVLDRLGVPSPTRWEDLADARLSGWLAMVNPAQSGSVLTAFESIVQRVGWLEGMSILRRAAANARTFAPSSTRGPIDVASGDAAMAVSIDFYGRFQAQVIADAARARGERPGRDRVQFVSPRGQSAVDPDPIAVLRNPPNPEMAARFVTFCLSPDAQRLWQLRAGEPGGPRRFELRRMPVMKSLYAAEGGRFIDAVDPFADASPPAYADPAMRPFIPILFNAMAMDCHEPMREAWARIAAHPAFPAGVTGAVTAQDVQDPELRAWLERFDAWPEVETPEGPRSLADRANLPSIRDGWLKGGWKDAGLWDPQQKPADAMRARFAGFFKDNYLWIVQQAGGGKDG